MLAPGMTALTGETGAGKTLLVDAIELLVGGRAESGVVRHGAGECSIEGRFVVDDTEVVLSRVIPRDGRSRAYRNGRLATVGQLAEEGRRLVDLHGQHSHQSLLGVAEQRSRARQVRRGRSEPAARARGRGSRSSMPSSPRSVATSVRGPERSTSCATKSTSSTARTWMIPTRIAGSRSKRIGWRTRRPTAMPALGPSMPSPVTGEHSTRSGLARAGLAGRAPFAELEARLHALEAEAADIGAELRHLGDEIADDPERLAEVRARRQLLRELIRKYGETLARGHRLPRRGSRTTRPARLARRSGRRARVAAGCRARRCRRRGAPSGRRSSCRGASARVRGAIASPRARVAEGARRDRRRR